MLANTVSIRGEVVNFAFVRAARSAAAIDAAGVAAAAHTVVLQVWQVRRAARRL